MHTEDRLYYSKVGYHTVDNIHTFISKQKSQMFEALPSHLANFEKWLRSGCLAHRRCNWSNQGRILAKARVVEDEQALDRLLANAIQNSHIDDHPEWYFLCNRYGLRQLLQHGEKWVRIHSDWGLPLTFWCTLH